jgi:nitrate/nitrite transporter NarK
MLFSGLFVGKIFDDYGPASLLSVGTFLHVFGLMMTSISTKYYQILLSQAVCSAIGASMVFHPAFTCVSALRLLLLPLLPLLLLKYR